jgi:hypothetical protein
MMLNTKKESALMSTVKSASSASTWSLKKYVQSRFRVFNAAAFNRLLIVAGVTGLLLEASFLILLSQLSTEEITSAKLPVVEASAF